MKSHLKFLSLLLVAVVVFSGCEALSGILGGGMPTGGGEPSMDSEPSLELAGGSSNQTAAYVARSSAPRAEDAAKLYGNF
jgi:hypothetical protein